MRRIILAVALVAAAFTACSSAAGTTRQVLVDYADQRFPTILPAYFPGTVTVHPGDTVHFRQAWNGEPHSVTLGTLVDPALKAAQSFPPQEVSDASPAGLKALFAHLPFMAGLDGNTVYQSAAQPCYLDTGSPPTKPATRCRQRRQPAFNGRQPYYSSGFIPYAGNEGNSFDVKLAASTPPGEYRYYCTFHGPFMSGTIVVKPKSSSIPSQAAVDRTALSEIRSRTDPAAQMLKEATAEPFDLRHAAQAAGFPPAPPELDTMLRRAAFAGFVYTGNDNSAFVPIDDYLPRTLHVRVGEKVTWFFVGPHTVSFNVPRYFPQLAIGAGGAVHFDDRSKPAIGGPGFTGPAPPGQDVYVADGGTWNGAGFRSSGLAPDTQEQTIGFSLAVSKAGTYHYACLIHPRMVGTLVVSE